MNDETYLRRYLSDPVSITTVEILTRGTPQMLLRDEIVELLNLLTTEELNNLIAFVKRGLK